MTKVKDFFIGFSIMAGILVTIWLGVFLVLLAIYTLIPIIGEGAAIGVVIITLISTLFGIVYAGTQNKERKPQ